MGLENEKREEAERLLAESDVDPDLAEDFDEFEDDAPQSEQPTEEAETEAEPEPEQTFEFDGESYTREQLSQWRKEASDAKTMRQSAQEKYDEAARMREQSEQAFEQQKRLLESVQGVSNQLDPETLQRVMGGMAGGPDAMPEPDLSEIDPTVAAYVGRLEKKIEGLGQNVNEMTGTYAQNMAREDIVRRMGDVEDFRDLPGEFQKRVVNQVLSEAYQKDPKFQNYEQTIAGALGKVAEDVKAMDSVFEQRRLARFAKKKEREANGAVSTRGGRASAPQAGGADKKPERINWEQTDWKAKDKNVKKARAAALELLQAAQREDLD